GAGRLQGEGAPRKRGTHSTHPACAAGPERASRAARTAGTARAPAAARLTAANIIDLSSTRTVSMGKGDKRSFKGKVFKHSYGKTRPRKKKKADVATTRKK
ncbi:MAG TPA: 30S ribosomal protein THX, partial [Usitatibacter sp.]|nr:30S ribosomal protein THX [Usitatibacter sp.]